MVVPVQPLPGTNHARGPGWRRLVALGLVVTACGGGPPTLPDTLGPLAEEVATSVRRLTQVLDTFYPSRTTLYQDVSALETTATAGDLYDQVSRLEEPSLAADLQRYARFVGDLLLASGDIDTAVARDRLEQVAKSWLGIEAAAGVLAVGVDPQWCAEVTPAVTADLCRPELPEGYDAGVERAIRLFLARYRPLVRLPAAFGDGVRAVLAMELQEEVLASIDAAMQDLAALTSPDDLHRRLHESFVAHLGAIREIWEAVPDSPKGLASASVIFGDVDGTTRVIPADESWTLINEGNTAPDVLVVVWYTNEAVAGQPGTAASTEVPPDQIWLDLAAQLTAEACSGSEAFAAARTPLRAAHPDSTLPALGELWFYGEGTGCP